MNKSEVDLLLLNVSELLKQMIESGAEIYRVEESAIRILTAYGAKHVDVYATTSNIIISVEFDDGIIKTHTRRIGQIGTDLEKLHRLNTLVRNISTDTPHSSQIKSSFDALRTTPKYPVWVVILFYGIIAGAFYIFFGGRDIIEFASSCTIGLIVGIIMQLLERVSVNRFLIRFVCSFFSCLVTFLLKKYNLISNPDYIIIGNIMTLIPGIGITNCMRDLFTGDSISGTLRLIETILLAVAIAAGYVITNVLFGGAL